MKIDMAAEIEIDRENPRNKNKRKASMIGKIINTYFLLGLR